MKDSSSFPSDGSLIFRNVSSGMMKEAVSNSNKIDKKNPKEFINIFFESGSLSDDNKKEVINYFFSKLS